MKRLSSMMTRPFANLTVVSFCTLLGCGGATSPSDGATQAQPGTDGATSTNPNDSGTPVGDASVGGNPGDGATGTPSDGAVPQDAAGPPPTGSPKAPANFQVTNQGPNDVALAWTASVAGENPVDHYKIYRNGKAYDTSKTTTYTDTKATNVTTPGYGPQPYLPATVYSYTVSAVDTKGLEGAQQTQCTAWVYHAGTDFWTSTTNNYSGGVTFVTNDKTGAPQNNAAADIEITTTAASNYWQPYSGQPFLHNMNPTTWAMEVGMFNYVTIDLKPTADGQTWEIDVISRVSPGDNYNSAGVIIGGADAKFGPQAVAGKWATYKIPFLNKTGTADGESLQVGFGKYMASINGTTMTVTQLLSGMNVQGSSYLSGTGINMGSASGTATYITSTDSSNGLAGTYTVAPSQAVAATMVTAQRTNMYKIGFQDLTFKVGNKYYVDNLGFTTE